MKTQRIFQSKFQAKETCPPVNGSLTNQTTAGDSHSMAHNEFGLGEGVAIEFPQLHLCSKVDD